eukprot:Rhum_TRINITY_DN23225_c0_g1::Rhum_TRINITY_DN23225_c0_g1_i1::g.177498::m.177498
MGIAASYLHATRPWSLTAGVIPVLVTAATVEKEVRRSRELANVEVTEVMPFYLVPEFYMIMLVIVLVQMGANLCNSYFDFVNKVDVLSDKGTCGDGTLLKPKKGVTLWGVVGVSILCYAAAVTLGMRLVELPTEVAASDAAKVFASGVALSILYTANPLPLKYFGLGDVVIFLCFGPLLMCFAAYVLAYEVYADAGASFEVFDPRFLVYCLPLALLTEGILHANNARDIENDSAQGCVTLATVLGFEASRLVFILLLLTSYASALYVAWTAHYGCVLTLLTLPLAGNLVTSFSKSHDMSDLPEKVAQTHLPFGFLFFVGIYFTDSWVA